jgi:hypothetical protein
MVLRPYIHKIVLNSKNTKKTKIEGIETVSHLCDWTKIKWTFVDDVLVYTFQPEVKDANICL